tara:strand:+ start:109 stop:705 length:597 start_codon:yes stop_codon:yes gene_type:complete
MSEVKVDTISERTAANGVAVDGVTIKDSGLTIPSGGTLTVASGGTITNSGTASGFGDNTPSWYVKLSTDFSCATGTYTKVEFDTEVWDTDSAYDSTTNYRFTVPVGEGGKYLVTGGVRWPTTTAGRAYYIAFFKNGTEVLFGVYRFYSTSAAPVFTNTAILDLAASDYCEMYVVQNQGSTASLYATYAYFSGFKLAGV